MKILRYQMKGRVGYGIWEDDFIQEISGSVFGDFEITSLKRKVSGVRLLPPAEPT